MRFIKMHGLGNDYVYVNGFEQAVDDPAGLAPRIADRHFGVGGDGLILVLPPGRGVEADVRMRMFNADGSESEMCGNGVRCVCKLAHDHGLSRANPMRVQTGAGVLSLDYTLGRTGLVDQVSVDMGRPVLKPEDVPVDVSRLGPAVSTHAYQLPLEPGEPTPFVASFVSMGNPHAVIFVDEVAAIDLPELGPKLEHHPAFPNRMNVHFVQVHTADELTMRTWERGSGITLACGTGAGAAAVAGVLSGRTDRRVLAHLPGGDLFLHWDEQSDHLTMTGPATEVFRGEWPD